MLVQLPTGVIDGMDHFNFVQLDELRGKQHRMELYTFLKEDGQFPTLPRIAST